MEAYLIWSSLVLLILYVQYRYLLTFDNNSQIKRLMGLFCVVFSVTFWLLPDNWLIPDSANAFTTATQTFIQSARGSIETQSKLLIPTEPVGILLMIYYAGVSVFTIRFFFGLFQLVYLYRTSDRSTRMGFTVVNTKNDISPFSFFHLLFINQQTTSSEKIEKVIAHELIHKKQWHSLDIIILQFVTIVFWFHPAIWWFSKDIRAQHEFLADFEVLAQGIDKAEYQHMLFETQSGADFKTVNYFSIHTSLKQRLKMMENQKTRTKNSTYRVALFIPMLIGALMLSSFSPSVLQFSSSSEPVFKVYANDVEVDLNRGIPISTKKLFVCVTDASNEECKRMRVSEMEVTLVANGLGQGSKTIRGENIKLKGFDGLVKDLKEGILLIEIKEYQFMDQQNRVEKINPEKMIFIKVPVFE